MQIELRGISKRFTNRWVLRDVSCKFKSGTTYGIKGINGSGKSTLMKIISGYLTPSKGELVYTLDKEISRDEIYNHISISAPYLELDEDFTLVEQIDFYKKFKAFRSDFVFDKVMTDVNLDKHIDKPIKNFSSGMKQRVQLIIALYSDVPCVLLDEPSAFLDEQGKAWLYDTIKSVRKDRLLIIASNEKEDLELCTEFIDTNQS